MVAKARHIDYNRIIVDVQFIYSLQKFFIYNYCIPTGWLQRVITSIDYFSYDHY